MVPHKQFPEPSPGNDLATYRPQMLGAPATMPATAPIGHHEAIMPALWRRRWSIAAITVLALLVGMAYVAHAKKLYAGMASITLNPNQPVMQPWGGPMAPTIIDTSWINTQIKIIGSYPVLENAAHIVHADKDLSPEELRGMLDGWGGNLYIDPGAKDQTITILFYATNARFAADVANAIVKAYQEHSAQSVEQNTNGTLRFLRSKAEDLKKIRQEESDALLDFQRDHADFMSQMTQSSTGGMLINTEIQKLRDLLFTARLAQIDGDSDYTAAKLVHDDPDKLRQMAGPAIVGQLDPEGQTLRAQLGTLELEIKILAQKGFGPNSPLMAQDEVAVKNIKEQLVKADSGFADAYVGALYQKMKQAEDKVTEYQKEYDDQMKQYSVLNKTAADYRRLNDQLQETTALLASLDDQIKKLDITGATGGIDVESINQAFPQNSPSKPAKYRILGLSLVIGLMLGLALALLRDRLDQRIHTPDEVVSLLGVPVIGMIPHMRRSLTPVARGQSVHWDPMSEVAEAYRAVRTAVTFGVPAGAAKTIVVTSPTPGDGKSTLASNLGIALAQAGKRTLILDSDFRRPVQHKLFEMSHEMGVTSVLAGRDALAKAIQKTACEGLDLLPSGPIPLNPSELLNGESFAEILDELAGVYDHIVLDCPPVMSVTDARILGAVCDVTILVVRANKVTRKNVEHARSMLASVGARLLGCVVNDVPRGQGQEGYYGGYGYAPIEPVVRRREDVDMSGINGHRHLPAPVDAGNGR